jgi:pimeloyl-ACP methyl ester carboxylesterase
MLPSGRADAPLLLCVHGGGCNGGYFDLPGFSVAEPARARGFDVLLLDRPGHGGSPAPQTTYPIQEAADLLPALLQPILRDRRSPQLAVLGHSIGGAVALTLAAAAQVPVTAVAVSGIGRTPAAAALAWLRQFEQDGAPPPVELFFGPETSYGWRAPLVLRRLVEPWRPDEVRETLEDWPRRFDAVAGAVRVPVSMDLAEHEAIWDPDEVRRGDLARRFHQAPTVQSAILPDGGHLYELHAKGPDLVARQLAFLTAAAGASLP